MKKFFLGVFFAFILTRAIPAANQMSVFFLDVGQGDSEILISGNHTIVIDTATEEMASRIISFLKSKNEPNQSLSMASFITIDAPGRKSESEGGNK